MPNTPLVRPNAPFAEALRGALQSRRMTLAGVRTLLDAAGHPVGLATLSSWQSGTRIPRRSSLDTVAALETALALPAGWLSRRVAARQDEFGAAAVHPDHEQGRSVAEQLNKHPAFRRTRDLNLQDRVGIGPDRCVTQGRSLVLVQAVEPTDEVVIAHIGESGTSADEVDVSLLSGGESMDLQRDADSPLVLGVVQLGRMLGPGETALLEYTVHDASGAPPDEVFRYLAGDDVQYLLEVSFDPRQLPCRLTSFSSARRVSSRVTHPLLLSADHRAHLLQRGGHVSLAGIGWEWED